MSNLIRSGNNRISVVLYVVIRSFILLAIAGYVTFIVVDVAIKQPYNLVSLGGLVMLLLLMFLYSVDRWKASVYIIHLGQLYVSQFIGQLM